MDELQQLARSRRYDSARIATIVQLDVDTFALFVPGHSFELAIGPWDELRHAFLQRPIYQSKPRVSAEQRRKEATEKFLKDLGL